MSNELIGWAFLALIAWAVYTGWHKSDKPRVHCQPDVRDDQRTTPIWLQEPPP